VQVGLTGLIRFYVQGAPESVLERCQFVRVGERRIPMTATIKSEIMKEVRHYGTGEKQMSNRLIINRDDYYAGATRTI